jgi:hypothetical protein
VDWLPLDESVEIEPGSALDFSHITPWHAPAGDLGRVVANAAGQLTFSTRPQDPVRFYGVNLCFTAQYLPHDEADRLAERFQRLGYNAVRIHHYDGMLTDRSSGSSTQLNPEALDKLDYLFAALKRHGIYVTTDLFVSRSVFAREVWEGADGDVGMDEYKMAVPVNDRAYANYKAFASALLTHVNPYTSMRWADDPTLAWLSLINEGNPGNFLGLLKGPLRDDWARAWNQWLLERYPDREARRRALGGQESADGAAPIPGDNSGPGWAAFNVFLADNQSAFYERTRTFLHDEIGCKALLTNNNAWTNPLPMETVRAEFDYVDDHFYVDHPEFLERPWDLPSRCGNTSPVADGAPGGRSCAFIRMLDRPFTCSEFNYAGPGRYRGVGGILTGALGAVQDWSVIWRFAFSHDRGNLFAPSPAGYFDMATDPLSQASERASICLFRRGDLHSAPHSVAVALTPADARKSLKATRNVVPGWDALAWVTRVGSLVATDPALPPHADLLLPVGMTTPRGAWHGALAVDPYNPDAGASVLAEMHRRGWLRHDNPTDLQAQRYQTETGELTIDAPADRMTVDTPSTAGGYASPGQQIRTGAATVEILDTPATVWVSSVDGKPIAASKRLLVTHLTDLQNSGAQYGDRAQRILMAWGGLPHLVRRGRATISINAPGATAAHAWGLTGSGKRMEPLPVRIGDGKISLPLDVDAAGKARMLYEIEVVR